MTRPRREQVEEVAKWFACLRPRFGCTCPLIYDRGGWPHDDGCPLHQVYVRLVEALCWWDKQCAWERATEETEWRAKMAAAQVVAKPYSDAVYQAWKKGQA